MCTVYRDLVHPWIALRKPWITIQYTPPLLYIHTVLLSTEIHIHSATSTAVPGFYMVNWLWMGKCHLKLGHKEEARPWLERTAAFETTLEEELEVCW